MLWTAALCPVTCVLLLVLLLRIDCPYGLLLVIVWD
jgi:hypothetical protein